MYSYTTLHWFQKIFLCVYDVDHDEFWIVQKNFQRVQGKMLFCALVHWIDLGYMLDYKAIAGLVHLKRNSNMPMILGYSFSLEGMSIVRSSSS